MALFQQSLRTLMRTSTRSRASRTGHAMGFLDGCIRRSMHRSTTLRRAAATGGDSEGPPSSPSPSNDAPSRLGLGGHQLSRTDPHKYLRIVRAALENGIRTIEAPSSSSALSMLASSSSSETSADDQGPTQRSGGGGEDILASTLRSLLQENSSLRSIPIEVLVRIGYDTKTMSQRETGDFVVETLAPTNDRSDASAASSAKEGSTIVVVHNVTGSAVQRRLEGSPLLQLSHEFPNVRIVPLLHNPEQQNSRRELDTAPLQTQLQESFSTLESMFVDGYIGRFGMVSNGLCLPRDHPLFLSTDVPVDAANKFSGYQVTQLPLNALETSGIAVARDLAERIDPSRKHQHEMYAMRPLACYPNRGTGVGHPFVLADLLIPEFVAGAPVIGGVGSDDEDDSNSGGVESSTATGTASKAAPPQLRWTNELPGSVPVAYESALKVSMQYFDAEELVQAKLEGKTLTAEQRETLDGCKLLQSLFHDLDAGLAKQRSMAAHEQYLTETVIPLIHDTFESYDEESAQVLENFFAAYTVAVRHAVAKNTRALLQGGEASVGLGSGADRESSPVYTIPPSMRLQEFGLRFVLDQPNISKVIVGATEIDQVVENVQIAWKAQASSLEKEIELEQ